MCVPMVYGADLDRRLESSCSETAQVSTLVLTLSRCVTLSSYFTFEGLSQPRGKTGSVLCISR